jgi:hypothetical protein
MDRSMVFTVALVLALAGIMLASATTKKTLVENVYADPYILEKGDDLPRLWLYYDTNDVNSRRWGEFWISFFQCLKYSVSKSLLWNNSCQ